MIYIYNCSIVYVNECVHECKKGCAHVVCDTLDKLYIVKCYNGITFGETFFK